MRILSLFDGISCARVALERAGIQVDAYYACEIEPNAIKVSSARYPDIQHLGDVRTSALPEGIDLLIGGSPCQDLSIAKKGRQGLQGERSGLFWEFVRIRDALKPTYFVLENVASMPKEAKDTISEALGVQPVLFDASLVSAQSRKRLFWTNISFTLPEDKGILLQDILQSDAEIDERFITKTGKSFCLTSTYANASLTPKDIQHNAIKKKRTCVKVGYIGTEGEHQGQGFQAHRVYSPDGLCPTLGVGSGRLIKVGHVGNSDSQGNRVYSPEDNLVVGDIIRKLTPIECERLQGLPDGYTEGIAMTQRYKCLGNAFNADVVAHILASIPT